MAAVTVLGPVETVQPVTSLPTTVEPTTDEVTAAETTTLEPTTIIPVTVPVPEEELNTLPSSAPQVEPRRRPPQPQRIDFTVSHQEVPIRSTQQAKQKPRPVPTPQLVRRRGDSQFTRVRVPQTTSHLRTGTRRTQVLSRRRGQVSAQIPVPPPQQQGALSPDQNVFHVPGSQPTFQQQHGELHGQHQSDSETAVTKEDQGHDEPFKPKEGQLQSERNHEDHSLQADQGKLNDQVAQEAPQDETIQPSHGQFQGHETSPEESVHPDQGQLPVDQQTQDDGDQLTAGVVEDQETSPDDSVQPQEAPFEGRQNPHFGLQPDQGQFQDQRRPPHDPFQQGQGHFQNPRRPQHDSFQQDQGQFLGQRRPQHDAFQPGQEQFQNGRRPQHDSFQQGQGHFQNSRRPQHDSFKPGQGQFQDHREPQQDSFQQDQGQFQDQRRPQHDSFQPGQGQFQGSRRPQHDSQQGQGQFQDQASGRPQHDSFQHDQGQFQDQRRPQHDSFQQGQQTQHDQEQSQDSRRPQQGQSQFQDQSEDQRAPQDQQLHQEEPSRGSVAPDLEAALREVVATLAEESPALPPAHPICFQPGLVADENRCWVFHECVLENNTWEVYSWKCMRGHVFDAASVSCVRGRCRRRG